MKFLKRYGVHLIAVTVIVGAVVGFNMYNQVHAMAKSHGDLLNDARERIEDYGVNPLPWALFDEARTTLGGVRETEALASHDGEEVMILGYAEPFDPEGTVTKLNDVTDLTQCIAGCCAKPIQYANVTAVDVAPLPPNCYMLNEQPAHARIRIDMSGQPAITFVANSPQLFSGVLRIASNSDDGVHYVLEAPKLLTMREIASKRLGSGPTVRDEPPAVQ